MMIVIKCELTNPTRRPFTEVNRNGKRTTPLEFSNSMRCQIQFSKVKTELKTKAGLGDVDHDGFGLVVEITARAQWCIAKETRRGPQQEGGTNLHLCIIDWHLQLHTDPDYNGWEREGDALFTPVTNC